MTRAQFLNDLYRRLEGLTQEQAEQHLTYYAEMLADRMEEGMSEEQAVESMEDVDTIARRILEEEAVQPSGQADRPPEPPVYPDASRIPGGGGTQAYQGKKKRSWRRPASVLLWALAILCALAALTRHFIRNSYTQVDFGDSADTSGYATEYVTEERSIEEDSDQPQAYYEGGKPWHTADGVSSVNIQWTSGTVEVTAWDGDGIAFTTDDGMFGVEWGSGGDVLRLSSQSGGRTLYLQIPSGVLSSLQINASSADVEMGDIDIGTLDVTTISGDVTAEWITAQAVNLTTTSGDIYFDGLTESLNVATTSGDVEGLAISQYFRAKSVSGKIDMDLQDAESVSVGTTSGNVDLSLEAPERLASYMDLRTYSGDIDLEIPEDLGFALTFETVSGDADLKLECTRTGKVYTHGDGSCVMGVSTTSGDLSVENW